jgi:hypothetical protein
MEFTTTGTVWVKQTAVEVEIEGNFYQISKADARKIVQIRQAQGYKDLKAALHGAQAQFKIVRGQKATLVLEPEPAKVESPEFPESATIIATPKWIDDSNEAEEGGYLESSASIKGKKIKLEVWEEKPKFDGGYGCEIREFRSEDGKHYWGVPLGQFAFWLDASFD